MDHGQSANFRELAVDLLDIRGVEAAISEAAERLGTPDTVIHLAAQSSVADSFANPAQTYEVNVVGTANLLSVLADASPEAKVLIPSSAHVYGPPTRPDGALDEGSPTVPDTHYGASKVAQEMVGRLFLERRGQQVYVTRAFNHVGPGQGPGFAFADFARRVALLEGRGGGVMRVGNLGARRDFLDVRDVVQAYLTVLDKGEPGVVYNVASGAAWSIQEILNMFLEEAKVGVDVAVDPALLRPVDVPILVGDAGRLRALGWAPRLDIRDTVRDTLDYWRERVAKEQAGEDATPKEVE